MTDNNPETTLQPGKPRTDKLGMETMRIRLGDSGLLLVVYDNETKCLRLHCHSYAESDRTLTLVKYDKGGLTLKF